MAGQAGSAASRTESSVAQGRFTVALPKEVGDKLDVLGKSISDAVFVAAGVRVEISRPQVISSLVETALAVQAEQASEG